MNFMKILCLFMLTATVYAKKAELVEISTIDPTIAVDLTFATGHEPFEEITIIMYPQETRCYIDKEVAYALKQVQEVLRDYGLSLKIRDGYRPLWAQKKLWSIAQTLQLSNPADYVSDPEVEGGRHTRGTAVDITVIDIQTGTQIELPPFCLSSVAHRDYDGPLLTQAQIANRNFIRAIMIAHGFSTIRAEWWHFDFKDWQTYEPLNIAFAELEQRAQ